MPLLRLPEPFDHPDWLFELKYDGFRALVYLEHGACCLISRNHHAFKTFPGLCEGLASELRGSEVTLDGEVVRLDRRGRPQFNTLLYRREAPCFAAFDLLWLDGRDLRDLPVLERKRRLRAIVPPRSARLLYVRHVESAGIEFFRTVCREDLEDIVAKWKLGPYDTEPTNCIKIKNPAYSQAVGRHERFDQMRAAAATPR